MSDKLVVALDQLEKARTAALEAAIGDRQYRLCAALDADGGVQRGIDRARKLLERRQRPNGSDAAAPAKKPSKK
jgi:hypothetical protein